jgi:predicted NAD/FAD-binding protein
VKVAPGVAVQPGAKRFHGATNAWGELRSVSIGASRNLVLASRRTVTGPHWRIAVLGAGAAGLSAADALRRAGYRFVTVLERSHRVGGKCCTMHLGGKSYELGAALLTTRYPHVRALVREVGMHPVAKLSGACLDLDTGEKTYRTPTLRDASWLKVSVACARMAAELVRHRRLLKPGFASTDADLATPFARWADAHGLKEAAKLLEPWFTTFGYGYIDEIPAAYALKYLCLFGPAFELLDGGYQELWERVARRLDVRCDVEVRRIVRDDDGITVETSTESTRFDAIVLACPIDGALRLLDVTTEERELFSRVRYQDYRVVVASVRDFCDARYLFFPKNFGAETRGEPMFAYRRWDDTDVRLFYSFGNDAMSLDDTAERAAAIVSALGGEVTRVHHVQAWRYFPHVGPDDMRAGFYDRVETLQGRRRTYYAGELLSFGTVENVVAYSWALVDRCFSRPHAERRTGTV